MANENIGKYWNYIPWGILPPSSKVDLCQFIARIKPAVRTCIKSINNIPIFQKHILELGWHAVYDKSGFTVISRNPELSNTIMQVDQSTLPHAIHLGNLLGYPECCSAYVEQQGEDRIDQAAESFKRSNLRGSFSLLDISKYHEGIALISHMPCSFTCQHSLNGALLTLKFIKKHEKINNFGEWASSIINYYSQDRII